MGRGQQAQVQQQGTQLLNSSNASSQQNQQEAQQGFQYLMPAYQSMYSNPGYTPAQKDAITRASEGGTGAAFGAAAQDATNAAARTNNAAGLTSNLDALARTRMQTAGAQTAQNETNFANNAQKQQSQALAGIGSLYSGAQGAGLGYAGQSNQALGTLQRNAATPSFWDQLTMGIIGNAGKAGTAVAAGCWLAAATYDGWEDPRTIAVRDWLNTEFVKSRTGRMVMAAYNAVGEELAWFVKRSALLRAVFKPVFDLALRKAETNGF